MIKLPPPNARPSLEQAVLWPFFISLGMAVGTLARGLGSGQPIDWGGTIFGQLVVTGIVALPFLVAVLVMLLSGGGARPLPGGVLVWGDPATLFYRTVRASLFMCGFVLVYLVVIMLVLGQALEAWALGALTNAAMTLAWFGVLSVGPWAAARKQGTGS